MAASEPKLLYIHKVRGGTVIYNLDAGIFRIEAGFLPWLQTQSQNGFLWPYNFRRVIAIIEKPDQVKQYLVKIEEIPSWRPKKPPRNG